MSVSLAVKFRSARTRITLKDSNTIGELKKEISVGGAGIFFSNRNYSMSLQSSNESLPTGQNGQMTTKAFFQPD